MTEALNLRINVLVGCTKHLNSEMGKESFPAATGKAEILTEQIFERKK